MVADAPISLNFTSQNLESCFVFIKIVLKPQVLVLFNRNWCHSNIEIAISYKTKIGEYDEILMKVDFFGTYLD